MISLRSLLFTVLFFGTTVILAVAPLLFVSAQCDYNNYLHSNGTCIACEWYQYPEGESCVAYSSVASKMAWDRAATIDTGDTAYMIVATAGVLVMTPALALFYGAMASEGNIMNTVFLSMVALALITIAWFLVGYSIAFGPGGNFWGTLAWGTALGVGQNPSGVYATTVPHVVFFSFQCMFSIITPALISGAIVGRMTFISYCIFITAWSIVVYCPLVRWVWSWKIDEATGEVVPNGWLLELGVIDFAGGTPIHLAAAAAALAASLIVGERLVKKDVKVDVTKLLVGTSLLWFGWTFGFNGGSALAAGSGAAMAFMNSHIATCAAVLAWMIAEFFHTGKATFVGACTAAVIGLVAITPACGYVSLQSSLALGGIPALGCYGFNIIKQKYLSRYLDDTLDVFLCHGVSAFIAMILLGIFADEEVGGTNGAIYGNPKQIGIQLAAACTSLVYSFCMSSVLLLILKYTIGIRVSEDEEINGLDAGHEIQEEDDSIYAPKDDDRPMAVIFTDIERSSALWMKRPTLMQRVLEIHNNAIKRVVQRHNMYIVKTIGDAFMIVGNSAASAVRFVVEVQAELYNEVWEMPEFEQYYRMWRIAVQQDKGSDQMSADQNTFSKMSMKTMTSKDPLWNGIRVRVGAHFGLCNVTFDQLTKRFDYFSTSVNIASRVESIGHGGQTIITEQLWNAAKGEDPKIINELVNTPLGEVHLRGIRDPANVFQLLPLNLALRKFPPLRLDKGGKNNNNNQNDLQGSGLKHSRSGVEDLEATSNSARPFYGDNMSASEGDDEATFGNPRATDLMASHHNYSSPHGVASGGGFNLSSENQSSHHHNHHHSSTSHAHHPHQINAPVNTSGQLAVSPSQLTNQTSSQFYQQHGIGTSSPRGTSPSRPANVSGELAVPPPSSNRSNGHLGTTTANPPTSPLMNAGKSAGGVKNLNVSGGATNSKIVTTTAGGGFGGGSEQKYQNLNTDIQEEDLE